MKTNRTIQIKAFLLMTVFSFSTILSFACSLGLDMWYNSGHHAKKNTAELIQKCCEKDNAIQGSKEDKQSQEKSDDCCTKSVIDFQMMTKSVVQPVIDLSTPPAYTQEHEWVLLFTSDLTISATQMKWAVFRTHKLLPPDIRVSIRSFQI